MSQQDDLLFSEALKQVAAMEGPVVKTRAGEVMMIGEHKLVIRVVDSKWYSLLDGKKVYHGPSRELAFLNARHKIAKKLEKEMRKALPKEEKPEQRPNEVERYFKHLDKVMKTWK